MSNKFISSSEVVITITLICLSVGSALSVILLANHMYHQRDCCSSTMEPRDANNNLNLTANNDESSIKLKWDESFKLYLPEKNATLIKSINRKICYLIHSTDLAKKSQIIEIMKQISPQELFQVAGNNGFKLCSNFKILLAKYRPSDTEFIRKRRETAKKQIPSCKDLLLDCTQNVIGEISECGTWQDDVMKMERVCLSPTEFQVTLYKPLVLSQARFHDDLKALCIEREKLGLPC